MPYPSQKEMQKSPLSCELESGLSESDCYLKKEEGLVVPTKPTTTQEEVNKQI